RVLGVAAFAGLFGMEGLAYAWGHHYAAQAWACLAVFVAIPLLMPRTWAERGAALAAAIPCAFVAYAVVELPLRSVSG
ncbi:DUF6518 family protein, partial [Streptomyces flavofungini]|uniref:DUF6518 family protein n=1 Tax=Streptomyces flavofungini TaxID=68200 RepID=UPI0034DF1AB9